MVRDLGLGQASKRSHAEIGTLQPFLEEKWQPNNLLLAERTTPTVQKVEKCDLFTQKMQGAAFSKNTSIAFFGFLNSRGYPFSKQKVVRVTLPLRERLFSRQYNVWCTVRIAHSVQSV